MTDRPPISNLGRRPTDHRTEAQVTRAVIILLVIGALTGTAAAALALGQAGLIGGLFTICASCFSLAGVYLLSDVDDTTPPAPVSDDA